MRKSVTSSLSSATLPSVGKLLEIPIRVDAQETRIVQLEAEVNILTHKLDHAQAEAAKSRKAHDELIKSFDHRVEVCLQGILAKINPMMNQALTKHIGQAPHRSVHCIRGSRTPEGLIAMESPPREPRSPQEVASTERPSMENRRYGVEASLRTLKKKHHGKSSPAVPKLDMATIKLSARAPAAEPDGEQAPASAEGGDAAPAPAGEAASPGGGAPKPTEAWAEVKTPAGGGAEDVSPSASKRGSPAKARPPVGLLQVVTSPRAQSGVLWKNPAGAAVSPLAAWRAPPEPHTHPAHSRATVHPPCARCAPRAPFPTAAARACSTGAPRHRRRGRRAGRPRNRSWRCG